MHRKKPPPEVFVCMRGRKFKSTPNRSEMFCDTCDNYMCGGPFVYYRVPDSLSDAIKIEDLPGRAFQVLRRGGQFARPKRQPIRRWVQLTRMSAADLMEYRGVGKAILKQVREALAKRGLHLAGEG